MLTYLDALLLLISISDFGSGVSEIIEIPFSESPVKLVTISEWKELPKSLLLRGDGLILDFLQTPFLLQIFIRLRDAILLVNFSTNF